MDPLTITTISGTLVSAGFGYLREYLRRRGERSKLEVITAESLEIAADASGRAVTLHAAEVDRIATAVSNKLERQNARSIWIGVGSNALFFLLGVLVTLLAG